MRVLWHPARDTRCNATSRTQLLSDQGTDVDRHHLLAMSSTKLTSAGSVSHRALDALSNDTNLPICNACGTQYPGPVQTCASYLDAHANANEAGPICEDPRQFVPESGHSFISLAELSATRSHHVTPDKEDGRISFISTEPGFGINQTRQ